MRVCFLQCNMDAKPLDTQPYIHSQVAIAALGPAPLSITWNC